MWSMRRRIPGSACRFVDVFRDPCRTNEADGLDIGIIQGASTTCAQGVPCKPPQILGPEQQRPKDDGAIGRVDPE